jgi:hypothetical protein
VNPNHLPTTHQDISGNYAESFDLEKYLRLAGGTSPETFDWSSPGPRLDDDALFCVGYMMDIESHTVIYLREMLSTAVAEDPSITAFLSCWAYEEFFHSQVLKRFLESQNVPSTTVVSPRCGAPGPPITWRRNSRACSRA